MILALAMYGALMESRGFVEKTALPLEIHVSLDRTDYVDKEPIFVEVTVHNKGKETVKVAPPVASTFLWLECKPKTGPKFKIIGDWVYHTPPLELFKSLAPQTSFRMWFDIRENYIGLGSDGEFETELVWRSVIYDSVSKTIEKRQMRSKKFAFKVCPPTGDDIEPVKIILSAIGPSRLKPDSEFFGYQGGMFPNKTLNNALLATKSGRFKGAAFYYRGLSNLSEAKWRGKDSQYFKMAVDDFCACKQSKGISFYLKGLCDYELIRCKEFEILADPKNKAQLITQLDEMTRCIQWNYPNSAFTERAQTILENYKNK